MCLYVRCSPYRYLTSNMLNGTIPDWILGSDKNLYGMLSRDGTLIAVKQLSSKSKQGNREFINEIGMISALQHPNLVKLYGCCIEGNQLLLIYEYMENNSLAAALFDVHAVSLFVTSLHGRGLQAYVLQEQGNLIELVDPVLGSESSKEEALRILNLALACTNPSPTRRPTMSNVVSILDGRTAMDFPAVEQSASGSLDLRLRVPENISSDRQSSMEILMAENISKEESSLLSSASMPRVST
ncbi:hypothetical protein B296_00019202 [Ensete ventricosum]|uniref:Protein kinase domain-containing protein n=1 Tax=Ensete ventricosum TaxID=4639 RepID=A0A426ZD08_ENSVE|nr:hypothetical protein B296_00019202 [Ensete ventricosum]